MSSLFVPQDGQTFSFEHARNSHCITACVLNHSHMCTHSCTVHNINTFVAHDAQTLQCRLYFHRNRILASEKGCKHFYCCHGNMDSVHIHLLRSEYLPSACMRVSKTSCGGDLLTLIPAAFYGAHSIVQFEVKECSSRGCGWECVRRRRTGLGEVILGFFSITVCSCLGLCCTLELGDKTTHARHRQSRRSLH